MLKKQKYPILEFDDEFKGVIHASDHFQDQGISCHCVLTFFQDVIEKWVKAEILKDAFHLKSEAGNHTVYSMNFEGKTVLVLHPMIGGPYAAGFMEELIASGVRNFIACGGAGVLAKEISVGHLVIPDKALRQEGTSYHYLKPSRFIDIDPVAIEAIESVLLGMNVPYIKGTTWTTDGFYRETKELVEYRKSEGCLTVEMECASFAAVAKFRGVHFGQILYGGDDMSGLKWDSRGWHSKQEIRESVMMVAIEACLKLN